MNTSTLTIIAITSIQQMADLRRDGWRPATLYQVEEHNRSRLAWFTYPTGERMINIQLKRPKTQSVDTQP